MESSSTKPTRVFRASGVSASAFKNTAKTADGDNTFYKVSLTRAYRDGDSWKSTPSLGRDDLPVAALLLERAWTFIVDAEARGDDN